MPVLPAPSSPVNRLSVARLRTECVVPRASPSPDDAYRHVIGAMSAGLEEPLAASLERVLPGSAADPGIWLIRRLNVETDVNSAWDKDRLRAAICAAISRSLLQIMAGGANGRDVIWFPDRPAYLAGFLSHRATGDARQWYYESFAGLRMLPTSAALRTAVCDDPAAGLDALLRLTPEARRQVLRSLSSQDAAQILATVGWAGAPAGDPDRCLLAAWTAWEELLGTRLDGDDSRDALRLYLAAWDPHAAGAPLRAAVIAMVRFTRWLESNEIDPGLAPPAPPWHPDVAALAPLLAADPQWLGEIAAAIRQRRSGPMSSSLPMAPLRDTRFGGVFLLLPTLNEMPLDDAAADWPPLDDVPAEGLVRFLLLVKCCGTAHALAAFGDPLLRDLLCIPPTIGPEQLALWQSGLSAAQHRHFLEALDSWHFDRGGVTRDTQLLVSVGREGRPCAVLLDAARGLWRAAGPCPRVASHLVRRWRRWIDSARNVLAAEPFVEPLRAAFPHLRISALEDAAESDTELEQVLSRLPTLADDLAYLAPASELGLSGALDFTLSIAAQGLLRTFAHRLPGFSRAHLPYLDANFLDFAATLQEEPGRRVVTIGRPPLHLVLGMTGVCRDSYRLHWLDDRPFVLFPGEP